ncbi:MAG: Holliday junction resolvase RuvX [Parcubacteria group bacterium]
MDDKILGIDYGQSKIGLAMADNETRMAFSYGMLKNDKDFLQKLAEIIEKENISKVIIGILSGSIMPRRDQEKDANKPLSESEKLGEFLKNKLKMEVEYQNEMFTTREAQRNLIEKGAKKIKRYDDQEAARIILQSWLDKKG